MFGYISVVIILFSLEISLIGYEIYDGFNSAIRCFERKNNK